MATSNQAELFGKPLVGYSPSERHQGLVAAFERQSVGVMLDRVHGEAEDAANNVKEIASGHPGAPFAVTVDFLDGLVDSGGEVAGPAADAAAADPGISSLSPSAAPPHGLSIPAVAHIFSLHFEQRRAFFTISIALAKSWRLRLEEYLCWEAREAERGRDTSPMLEDRASEQHAARVDTDPIELPPIAEEQQMMYLGGGGGVGKSHVIDAVSYFAQSWQRPHTVSFMAPKGVAASCIGGSTVHTMLKMALRFHKQAKASVALVQSFSGATLIIIDELSMVRSEICSDIEQRLREVAGSRVAFGGFHVFMSGDLHQLPPVVDTPIYFEGAPRRNPGSMEQEHIVGRRRGVSLWRLFRTVIFLKESVRMADDAAYAAICDRVRNGKWSE